MNNMQPIAWQDALFSSWAQVWGAFAVFLPSLILAIALFVIGIFVAVWGKRLIEKMLTAARVESLSASSGFSAYLGKADIKLTATEIIGEFVKWVLLLVFFIAAIEVLGLQIVSKVLVDVLSYIPNVIAAAFIIGVGFVIAGLVDALVRGAIASIDHEVARPVGRMARWVVIVVAFFAAINQLNIAPALVQAFFDGLTWTLVLIVGLSVGLGSKDLVAKFLDDWYKRVHK